MHSDIGGILPMCCGWPVHRRVRVRVRIRWRVHFDLSLSLSFSVYVPGRRRRGGQQRTNITHLSQCECNRNKSGNQQFVGKFCSCQSLPQHTRQARHTCHHKTCYCILVFMRFRVEIRSVAVAAPDRFAVRVHSDSGILLVHVCYMSFITFTMCKHAHFIIHVYICFMISYRRCLCGDVCIFLTSCTCRICKRMYVVYLNGRVRVFKHSYCDTTRIVCEHMYFM